MATTTLIPLKLKARHQAKTAMSRAIDYITDKDKTQDTRNDIVSKTSATIMDYVQQADKIGQDQLVSSYLCDTLTAAQDFAILRDEYEVSKGRREKDNARLAYHMRQSFLPGEIEPQTAHSIGHQLALAFTGGKHAFILATHTDKAHIHNHIIFSAYTEDGQRKFKDLYFSGKHHLAKLSDRLCLESNLSVVEQKEHVGVDYGTWQQANTTTHTTKTLAQQLQQLIDQCLEKQPDDFQALLDLLRAANCQVKKRGQDYSITLPSKDKPIRLSSLAKKFSRYSESALTQRIEQMSSDPKQLEPSLDNPKRLGRIINVENSTKMQESLGLKTWARGQNATNISETLLVIRRHGFTGFDDLDAYMKNTKHSKHEQRQTLKQQIDPVKQEMLNIRQFQKHIGTYLKTKDIYKAYQQLPASQQDQFKQKHGKHIERYQEATAYFDQQGYGFKTGNKLPTIKQLTEQYATLNTQQQVLWAQYHETKNMAPAEQELHTAYQNAKDLLGIKNQPAFEYSNESHQESQDQPVNTHRRSDNLQR